MKTGSKLLIAGLALAMSPLLSDAQLPPGRPGPGGPEGRPEFRMGQRPGAGMGRFGRRGGPRRGFQRGDRGAIFLNPAVRERLGITPEQATKFQTQRSAFQKSQIRSQADLRIKRMELGELVRADKPDRALIDKKMREINESEFATKKTTMDHQLAMRDWLTPEQKQKFQQWREEQRKQRMERGFGPGRGPDGGPGPGRGPRRGPRFLGPPEQAPPRPPVNEPQP